MTMRIDILTLFPDMFRDVLGTSIPARAEAAGCVRYHLHDIRAHAEGVHAKVDDRPFGGGPGMVLMCEPLDRCVADVERHEPEVAAHRILLSPQGPPLTQRRVEELAAMPRLLLICGHYEGIDERVVDKLEPEEISIGDYVLSGGELPAMVLVDAIARLLPGALGHADSASEDSFCPRPVDREAVDQEEAQRLLDHPHYTRPRTWQNRPVPDVLVSGDHGAVDRWRLEQMIERTQLRRPDLFGSAEPTADQPTPESA